MNYYMFTLFIFILVCAALILWRALFGGVKKQNKLLDEKEKKLLKLYEGLEESMEDFYATADETKRELEQNLAGTVEQLDQFKKIIAQAAGEQSVVGPRPKQAEAKKAPVTTAPDAGPVGAAVKAEPPGHPEPDRDSTPHREAEPDLPAGQQVTRIAEFLPAEDKADRELTKQEQIMRLARQGMSPKAIAEDLAITMSEVNLVLGMMRTIQKA